MLIILAKIVVLDLCKHIVVHIVPTRLTLRWLSMDKLTALRNVRVWGSNHICILLSVATVVLQEAWRLSLTANTWVGIHEGDIMRLYVTVATLALRGHARQKLLQIWLGKGGWLLNLTFRRARKILIHLESLLLRNFPFFGRYFYEVKQHLVGEQRVPLFILAVTATMLDLNWIAELSDSIIRYECVALVLAQRSEIYF